MRHGTLHYKERTRVYPEGRDRVASSSCEAALLESLLTFTYSVNNGDMSLW